MFIRFSITAKLNRALKLHGMTCRYIPADCPSVDDQIEIYNADGSESVVHLQLCACGELIVNEWVDNGDAMLHHPPTRSATKAVALAASRAIDHALARALAAV